MTQICYPGQTIRINTGWSLASLPDANNCNVDPDQSILNYDIIGFNSLFQKSTDPG